MNLTLDPIVMPVSAYPFQKGRAYTNITDISASNSEQLIVTYTFDIEVFSAKSLKKIHRIN